MRTVYGFVLMVTGLPFIVGCGPTFTQLQERRTEIQALKQQKRTLDTQLKRFKAVAGTRGNGVRLVVSKGAILNILKRFHPHSATGEKLSKKHLRGTFSLDKPSDVQMLGPDRLRHKVRFSGRQVQVDLKGVPFAGPSKERELKAALTGGADVTVETQLRLDRKRGALWLTSECTQLKLTAHNTRQNREYLTDALNKKIFNVPKIVPLPKHLISKRSFVLVARDGVFIANPK